jgi:outer membrane protein assembly factor BamB
LWPVSGQGSSRQAHNALEHQIDVETVGSLQGIWQATVDDGPVGDPVTSGRGVHVNDTRNVYGFGFVTGARRWVHSVAAPLEMQQPWVSDTGDVMVSWWNPTATPETDPTTSDLSVALDAATGASKGDVGEGVLGGVRNERALVWSNEFVRVGGPFGAFRLWSVHLVVRDLSTSTTVCCTGWFGLFSSTQPPIALQRMTLGGDWIVHAGEGILDLNSSVPVAGNGIRGYSIASTQVCLGAYTCPSWATPIDGTTATAPVLSDDESIAYVGTDAGTVYAVDTATGAIQWSAPAGSAVTDSPALADGSLFVPTALGDLVVLGQATGAPLWSSATGSRITQQPAVAGGVVFTGSADGTVRAFNAAGCAASVCGQLWADSTGSEITGAPAVNQGQLYVGTADGRLIAYGLPHEAQDSPRSQRTSANQRSTEARRSDPDLG